MKARLTCWCSLILSAPISLAYLRVDSASSFSTARCCSCSSWYLYCHCESVRPEGVTTAELAAELAAEGLALALALPLALPASVLAAIESRRDCEQKQHKNETAQDDATRL